MHMVFQDESGLSKGQGTEYFASGTFGLKKKRRTVNSIYHIKQKKKMVGY